ncbi:hypothetical protein ACWDUI_33530, partial [Streptosporangium sandarakinum]
MKGSVRLRFALACGGVFVLVGIVLVAVLALVVRQSLEPRDGLRQPRWISVAGNVYTPDSKQYYIAGQRVAQVRRVYQADTVRSVLTWGGVANRC